MNDKNDAYERVQAACAEAVEQLKKIVAPAALLVTFDGGKSWGTVDAVAPDVEALLMSHREAAGVENKQIRIYSSMAISGSFTFKPKKAPKVRQTPPFWSAYK